MELERTHEVGNAVRAIAEVAEGTAEQASALDPGEGGLAGIVRAQGEESIELARLADAGGKKSRGSGAISAEGFGEPGFCLALFAGADGRLRHREGERGGGVLESGRLL